MVKKIGTDFSISSLRLKNQLTYFLFIITSRTDPATPVHFLKSFYQQNKKSNLF